MCHSSKSNNANNVDDSLLQPTSIEPKSYGWENPVKQFQPSQDLNIESWVRKEAANTKQAFTGQIITFDFDQIGVLDPSSVYLTFNVQNTAYWTSVSARTTLFSNDIRCVFNRLRILYGRTCVLEDIQDYGSLTSLFSSQTTDPNKSQSVGSVLTGTQSITAVTNVGRAQTDRANYHNYNNTNVTDNYIGNLPRRYVVRLNAGLFQQKKWLPLFNLREKLSIELTVADPRECSYFLNAVNAGVVGSQATPPPNNNLFLNRGICVSLPELHYTYQQVTPQLQQVLEKQLIRGIQLQYNSFYHQRFPLNVYNARHSLKIPCIKKRVLFAFAVLRNDEERIQYVSDPMNTYAALDPRIGGNYTGSAPRNDYDGPRRTLLKNYQWRYNGQMVPEKPVRVCEGPHTLTASPTSITPIDGSQTYTGIAAEAYRYANYVLHGNMYSGIPNDNSTPGLIDNFVSQSGVTSTVFEGSVINNTNNNSDPLAHATTRLIKAYTSSLPIVGKFYTEHMDGETLLALDGTQNNGSLELILQFNDAFRYNSSEPLTYPGLEPKMVVDVWVCYDTLLTLDINNNLELDQ